MEDFPVFENVDAGVMRSLRKQGRVFAVEKDCVVHSPMETCGSVGFILSGALRMTKIFSSRKELVIRCLTAGETYGELVGFAGGPYPCWIVASQAGTVFEIGVESLYQFLKKEDFIRAFMKDISRKSLHLTQTIETLSFNKVSQRIAYVFLSMYEKTGELQLDSVATVTGLAALIGSSREAVSRSLSELALSGCIERNRGRVTIRDIERLEDILMQ